MRAYVGVTDGDWYRFLAGRPALNEVNFWRPSGGRTFDALTPGEPFFFKTHYPHSRIVGGGSGGFAALRVSEAWDFFDLSNGVHEFERLVPVLAQRLGEYRAEALRARTLHARALAHAGETGRARTAAQAILADLRRFGEPTQPVAELVAVLESLTPGESDEPQA